MTLVKAIEKKLSANDVGNTGSHQGGILIPKKKELLDFFPKLDEKAPNPRIIIKFLDEFGIVWKFNYIFYNNKLRGGTRSEYRLTGMTLFIRQNGLKEKDTIRFELEDSIYRIKAIKDSSEILEEDGCVVLDLGNNWKVINL